MRFGREFRQAPVLILPVREPLAPTRAYIPWLTKYTVFPCFCP